MERKEGGVAFKENAEIDKAERMRGNPPIKRSPTHAASRPSPSLLTAQMRCTVWPNLSRQTQSWNNVMGGDEETGKGLGCTPDGSDIFEVAWLHSLASNDRHKKAAWMFEPTETQNG